MRAKNRCRTDHESHSCYLGEAQLVSLSGLVLKSDGGRREYTEERERKMEKGCDREREATREIVSVSFFLFSFFEVKI